MLKRPENEAACVFTWVLARALKGSLRLLERGGQKRLRCQLYRKQLLKAPREDSYSLQGSSAKLKQV